MRRHRRLRDRLNVDWEKTAAAGFAHRDSHITLDGRWVLYGKDMSNQRVEALIRDKMTCINCGERSRRQPSVILQVHHKEHKGRGKRNDHMDNLETLCRSCHTAHHGRYPRWSKKGAA